MKRLLEITIDRAPEENGPEFDAWCETYGFMPLNSVRRAWCDQHRTYFRNAIGVGITASGEQFLVWEEDFTSE